MYSVFLGITQPGAFGAALLFAFFLGWLARVSADILGQRQVVGALSNTAHIAGKVQLGCHADVLLEGEDVRGHLVWKAWVVSLGWGQSHWI